MKKVIAVFCGIIVICAALFFSANYYVNKRIREKLNKKIEQIKPIADISYKDLNYSLLTGAMEIDGLRIFYANSPYPINIEKIVIRKFDRKNRIPSFLDVNLTGISLNTKNFGKEGELILRELGYEGNINGDLSISYIYDKKEGRLNIENFDCNLKNIGEVSLKIVLDNVDLKELINPAYLFISGWMRIEISKGKFSYTDEGLFDRGISLIAREKNLTPEQVKSELINKIEQVFGREGNSSKDVEKALIDFVMRPGYIKLTFNPVNPVPLGQIAEVKTANDLFTLLNIRIESK